MEPKELLINSWTELDKREQKLTEERRQIRSKHAANLWRLRKLAQERGKSIGLHKVQANQIKALLELQKFKQNLILSAKSECKQLVFKIAEEVLATSIPGNNASLAARITRELKKLAAKNSATVAVNSADFQAAQKSFKDSKMQIRIEENKNLPKDSALLITEAGTVKLDWRIHLEFILEYCNQNG